jgi:hypothetical protein
MANYYISLTINMTLTQKIFNYSGWTNQNYLNYLKTSLMDALTRKNLRVPYCRQNKNFHQHFKLLMLKCIGCAPVAHW